MLLFLRASDLRKGQEPRSEFYIPIKFSIPTLGKYEFLLIWNCPGINFAHFKNTADWPISSEADFCQIQYFPIILILEQKADIWAQITR